VTGQTVPPSTAEARVVWRDGDLELTTCPVRALTPDVQATLARFEQTHTLTIGMGVTQYTLSRLPGPGALDAQDARTMAELAYVQQLQNALLLPRPRAARRDRADREAR
jgi:hypothetical protein